MKYQKDVKPLYSDFVFPILGHWLKDRLYVKHQVTKSSKLLKVYFGNHSLSIPIEFRSAENIIFPKDPELNSR